MDILAHGLWSAAAAKTVNPRLEKPLRLRWFVLWGVFPDLFAFSPRVVAMIWLRFVMGTPPSRLPVGPGPDDGQPFLLRPWDLYQLSHSLVVFAAVFALVWLVRRRPCGVMLAWLLHILMDIPTHSMRFYATPFLWPLSSYRFDGISWAQPWFMILNYFDRRTTGFQSRMWKRKPLNEMMMAWRGCQDEPGGFLMVSNW